MARMRRDGLRYDVWELMYVRVVFLRCAVRGSRVVFVVVCLWCERSSTSDILV